MAAETRADAVELSMWKRTWWMMSEKRSKEWGLRTRKVTKRQRTVAPSA